MQHVLQLLEARSRGEILNDAVENAVLAMLGKEVPKVNQDTDEYDDIHEEESKPKSISSDSNPTTSCIKATLNDMVDSDDGVDAPLDLIPMGHAAAKMMITFGDGPSPHPAAVQMALLGCRRCLQVAIKDARAIRRSQKAAYATARRQVHRFNKSIMRKYGKISSTAQAADSTMLYRAIDSYDKLAYDPKCGFDVEQLRQLFPEEIAAYERWKDMHEATQLEEENGVSVEDAEESKPQNEQIVTGGHLQERAAQFDVRTDAMKGDWYMTFAEVRTGSFLPRRSQKKTQEEKTWDATRTTTRGRTKDGVWDNMNSASVRFLHWLGFDPRSSLPPPGDETTQALAFLGYDIMGRIIETAIEIRVRKRNGEGKETLLELNKGEQLCSTDIEKALGDASIKPVSLYSGSGEGQEEDKVSCLAGAQLYFGPGFEERLEMELDELVSGSKKRKQLSSEEQEIRKKEDAIFEELSKNPLFAVGIERGSNETTESAEAEKEPSKKVTLAKKKTGNK